MLHPTSRCLTHARAQSARRFLLCVLLGLHCVGAAPVRLVQASEWFGRHEAPADADELPPKQAAIACEATAQQLVKHGHVQSAIRLFERARELDSKQAQVARELAVLYDQVGDDVQALKEYQKALKEDAKSPDLLNDLGYFYLTRGDFREADKWFTAALAKDPEHRQAQGNLALAVAEQRRYQEAFELFRKVAGPAAAHSNLGVILVRHGDHEQAKTAFRQALRLDESLEPAKSTLAYLETERPTVLSPRDE